MAFPTIVFDRDTGADGDSASGAGPDTAVTGTKARNRSSGTRVGFFEASAPDLSLVNVDGSHALYLATSSGRKLFKISAKKDTAQAVVGSMSSGTSSLTSTDTTDWTVGDVISVANAGPSGGPLYTTVASIGGPTTATTNDNAQATVSGVAVANPKQVTVHTAPTIAADMNWAIGGRRNAPMSATFLPGDLLAGWGVRFIAGTFQRFAFTSAWTLTVSGNSTDGPIRIEGEINSEGRRPRVGGTAGVSPFTIRATNIRITDVAADEVDAVVLVDSTATSDLYCRGLLSYDSSYGVRLTSAATGSRFRIENCDFSSAATMPISVEGPVRDVTVESCYYARVAFGGAAKGLVARGNLFAGPVGAGSLTGILIDTATAAVNVLVEGNAFVSLLEGVRVKDAFGAQSIVVRNNEFSLNGTGITSDVATFDNVAGVVDYNNFWGNSTDRSNVSAGANDTAVDPGYRTSPPSSAPDLRPSLSLRGAGWPTHVGVANDPGAIPATPTSIDIGCVQRREPVGGTVVQRVVSTNDLGPEYEVALYVANGDEAGAYRADRVLKSDIPLDTTASSSATKQAILTHLRDGTADELIGQEVLS